MATVLIVEDEDVLRETLSSFLTRQGHDVIAAASGYEALEIGLDASPDVLVAIAAAAALEQNLAQGVAGRPG